MAVEATMKMDTANWRPLNPKHEQYAIPWMFKFTYDTTGYTFSVTDLSRIWTEFVREDDIKRRADAAECPIDPSQGADQLYNLYRRLKEALLGCAEHSAIALRHDDSNETLSIQLTLELPKTLGRLSWRFFGVLQSSECFRSQMFLPLIQKINLQTTQLDHMTSVIDDKDAALSNIMHKAESSGIDFLTIFPGAVPKQSGSHADKQEILRKNVKGLRPFKPHDYFNNDSQADSSSLDVKNIELAFCGFRGKNQDPSWPQNSHTDLREQSKPSKMKRSKRNPSQEHTYDDYLSSSETLLQPYNPTSPTSAADLPLKISPASHITPEDETTDEERTESVSISTKAENPSIKSTPYPKQESSRQSDGGDFASEISKPFLRHNTIGRIGGLQTSRISQNTSSEAEIKDPGRSNPTMTPPHRPKLGRIGGLRDLGDEKGWEACRTDKSSISTSVHEGIDPTVESPLSPSSYTKRRSDPNAHTTPHAGADIKLETSGEKDEADQKRETLKRDLETKGRLPGRKKRKF